jgi:hypothetical protein
MTGRSTIHVNGYDALILHAKNSVLDHASIGGNNYDLENTVISNSTIDGSLAAKNLKVDHSALNFTQRQIVSPFAIQDPPPGCTADLQALMTDSVVQNSTFFGMICASHLNFVRTVEWTENYYSRGHCLISGDSISIVDSTFESILIGNQISITGSTLAESDYRANLITMKDSTSSNAALLGFTQFDQLNSNLQGVRLMSNGPAHLDHAAIQEWSEYDHPGGYENFKLEPNTTFVNGTLSGRDQELDATDIQLGTEGQAILLDGHGKTYVVHRAAIHNQAELELNGN